MLLDFLQVKLSQGFICKLLHIPQKLVVNTTLSNYYPRTQHDPVILFHSVVYMHIENPSHNLFNNHWASVILQTLWYVLEELLRISIPALEDFGVHSGPRVSIIPVLSQLYLLHINFFISSSKEALSLVPCNTLNFHMEQSSVSLL